MPWRLGDDALDALVELPLVLLEDQEAEVLWGEQHEAHRRAPLGHRRTPGWAYKGAHCKLLTRLVTLRHAEPATQAAGPARSRPRLGRW